MAFVLLLNRFNFAKYLIYVCKKKYYMLLFFMLNTVIILFLLNNFRT